MNTTQTMDAMQAQRLEGSIGGSSTGRLSIGRSSMGGSETRRTPGALWRLWTLWIGASRLAAAARQPETAEQPAAGTGPMSGISEIATHPTRTADAAAAADAPQGRQTNADAARWGAALLDQLGVSARR